MYSCAEAPTRRCNVPRGKPPIYRMSRNAQGPILDIDQVEAIEPAIRSSEPGRYHVEEISAAPLPGGHTSH